MKCIMRNNDNGDRESEAEKIHSAQRENFFKKKNSKSYNYC